MSQQNEKLRVVTSCRSRFFIFDQARELARHQFLHQLITDYPKSWPARFGISTEKVRPLLFSGFIYHGLDRTRQYIPKRFHINMDRWIHNRFSKKLVNLIPKDTEYF